MSGSDKRWDEWGGSRGATKYAGLKPGHYNGGLPAGMPALENTPGCTFGRSGIPREKRYNLGA